MENVPIIKEDAEDKLLKFAVAIDEFEGYLHSHAARVAVLSDALARKFNLASHDRFSMRQAALLHDIGEPVMNRDYIKSDRALTGDERIDMQRHPVIGEQEAARLGLPRGAQLIVRWHHEWWNGDGYPDGLESEQIPLGARILRVADAYGSLTASRPFRAAWPENVATKHLIEFAGIEFDPGVVKALMAAAEAARVAAQQPAGVPATN